MFVTLQKTNKKMNQKNGGTAKCSLFLRGVFFFRGKQNELQNYPPALGGPDFPRLSPPLKREVGVGASGALRFIFCRGAWRQKKWKEKRQNRRRKARKGRGRNSRRGRETQKNTLRNPRTPRETREHLEKPENT